MNSARSLCFRGLRSGRSDILHYFTPNVSYSSTNYGASSSSLSSSIETTIENFQSPIKSVGIIPTISLATANSKEILQHNIRNQIDKYNLHGTDTGSTPVQIAILTEKIQNLTRHALAHKKDKNSLRSFQMLVSKRARLMKYLKKSNLKLYKEILSDFDPLLNETAKIL